MEAATKLAARLFAKSKVEHLGCLPSEAVLSALRSHVSKTDKAMEEDLVTFLNCGLAV